MNKFAKIILILIFVLLGVQVALGVIGLKQAKVVVTEPVEEPVVEVVDEVVLDEVDTETDELIACIELNCLNIAE